MYYKKSSYFIRFIGFSESGECQEKEKGILASIPPDCVFCSRETNMFFCDNYRSLSIDEAKPQWPVEWHVSHSGLIDVVKRIIF